MQKHKCTVIMLKSNANILTISESLSIALLPNPYQETSTFYVQIVAVAKGLHIQQSTYAA